MGVRETELYDVLAEELNARLEDTLLCAPERRVQYNLRYTDEDTRAHSFRTDLTILEDGYPRVIVELKQDSASTHDLLAYDAKADRHKRVYPSVRYGMFLVETSGLTKKYLWHTDVIDFFYFSNHSMRNNRDFNPDELDELSDLIQNNVETSRRLEAHPKWS